MTPRAALFFLMTREPHWEGEPTGDLAAAIICLRQAAGNFARAGDERRARELVSVAKLIEEIASE